MGIFWDLLQQEEIEKQKKDLYVPTHRLSIVILPKQLQPNSFIVE